MATLGPETPGIPTGTKHCLSRSPQIVLDLWPSDTLYGGHSHQVSSAACFLCTSPSFRFIIHSVFSELMESTKSPSARMSTAPNHLFHPVSLSNAQFLGRKYPMHKGTLLFAHSSLLELFSSHISSWLIPHAQVLISVSHYFKIHFILLYVHL